MRAPGVKGHLGRCPQPPPPRPSTNPDHPATLPLDDSLAALAPPHHQGGHEQGDQDGHHDEGPQDAVGRVPQQAARQRAVVEVVPVHLDEELVHQPVGPETLHLLGHQEGAVGQLSVQPAGGGGEKEIRETGLRGGGVLFLLPWISLTTQIFWRYCLKTICLFLGSC